MPTTPREIAAWFRIGLQREARYMLVVCDKFDWSDYPVYVDRDADPWKVYKHYQQGNMVRVMEVYNLDQDMETQLAMHRAFNLPPQTLVELPSDQKETNMIFNGESWVAEAENEEALRREQELIRKEEERRSKLTPGQLQVELAMDECMKKMDEEFGRNKARVAANEQRDVRRSTRTRRPPERFCPTW